MIHNKTQLAMQRVTPTAIPLVTPAVTQRQTQQHKDQGYMTRMISPNVDIGPTKSQCYVHSTTHILTISPLPPQQMNSKKEEVLLELMQVHKM